MRIVHLYRNFFCKDGSSFQTRKLVYAQAKVGHDVVTISLASKKPKSLIDSSERGAVHEEVRSGVKGLRQLRALLSHHQPDIVHFTGTWIPIHILWALEVLRANIPFVVSTHGNFSPYGMTVRFGGKRCHIYHVWAKKLWQRWFDIPLLRYAVGVHAHSRYEAELLRAVRVKKIFIVPTGIDRTEISLEKNQARKLHSPITFLHLGRLDIHHKGLDLICETLAALVESGYETRCKVIFVGPTVNDSKEVLQRWAARLGNKILEIRDALWGEAKNKIWSEVDYFLNLYRFAGIALAPCEAISHGLPLVSSREGNLGDWTAQANMGFVVPLDRHKLKEAILEILQIPQQHYQCLSNNALKFAQTYTWEQAAKEVIEGYRHVLRSAGVQK